MANNIVIEFGAKIDQLISAVNQVKTQLSSLNSTASGLEGGFSRLKELLISVFSIHEIDRFVESMADLGLQTERTMATLGMTASQVGDLSGMAKLTGTSMDSLAVQINRFSLNVQRSTADAVNPQAEALRVLGLRAKDLIGLPAAEYIDRLHDAVSKFNPSLNLTNALTAIGGRGFAQMLPFLLQNKQRWDELKISIQNAKEGLAAAIPGMADTHVKLSMMEMAVQSLGARLFTVLKPAIDFVIESITRFVEKLKSEDIRTYALNIGNWLIDMAGTVMTAFAELGVTIDNFKTQLSDLVPHVEVKVGGVADRVIKYFQSIIEEIRSNKAALQGDDFQLMAEHLNQTGTAADNAKTKITDFINTLKAQLGSLLSLGATTKEQMGGGADASAMNEGLSKALADRLKIIENNYKAQTDLINTLYGNYSFAEGQKTRALLAALNQRVAAEIAAGEKADVAWSKYALDFQKIQDQSLKAYRADLESVFGAIQGSINGQLRGLLAGTTSFAQAAKTILGDMIIWVIQQFEKMGFEYLTQLLMMQAADKGAAATKLAVETASQEATLPARIAKFTSAITADSAEVFAGIFANLAPFLGPAAAAPAAAGQATVLAQMANIPKFDLGTNLVVRTGLAMIHQGERITPATGSGPYSGATAGGTSINLTISAIDSRSFANLVNSNPSIFTGLIRRAMRDNQLSLQTVK